MAPPRLTQAMVDKLPLCNTHRDRRWRLQGLWTIPLSKNGQTRTARFLRMA